MKKHVSPENFEGKKQRAIAVLSQYSSDDKVADLYDHDQEFSGAMIDLFSPGFEYPDYSHLTIGQALAKARRSGEGSMSATIEGICTRLLDSEEHAVESAVPGIAEEAVELIQRLWCQLQSARCIANRQQQDSAGNGCKQSRQRPSWRYVCEHFGLDESFQYTDKQKEEYYTLLSADASKDAATDMSGDRKDPAAGEASVVQQHFAETVSYVVSATFNHAPREFTDVQAAAEAFRQINAADRPAVIRVIHGSDIGPGGRAQVIANTRGKIVQGLDWEYWKDVSRHDPAFLAAYQAEPNGSPSYGM